VSCCVLLTSVCRLLPVVWCFNKEHPIIHTNCQQQQQQLLLVPLPASGSSSVMHLRLGIHHIWSEFESLPA
jgi:hypothetical protein